ncbi:MAG: AraC family transcriptional regulator, partial [Psychrobacillus psychrotolerans]|uniref:AraC family transcriptional regulator n=1 Tax=Psychrobacillus psychrotolerans TaxID=126156 RepID=UPI003BAE67A3
MSELYYSEITRKTVSYIESNLTENINLDSFTSVIGYSKFHLSRLFKKDTGKSIVEYIR